MKYKTLKIFAYIIGVSLVGILITQTLWLRKTAKTVRDQFDHRVDIMLNDVVGKLMADNPQGLDQMAYKYHSKKCVHGQIDSAEVHRLLDKYTSYHKLDSLYSFAVVRSKDGYIFFSKDYEEEYECYSHKVCLSCVCHDEYSHLSVYFANHQKMVRSELRIWIALSAIFVLIIASAFVYIIVSIFKQKKLSEIKNDFINNMTHEFKTPISTISLASEILMKPGNAGSEERVTKYSKIIFDENKRMRKQVEQVLNVAVAERNKVKIKFESVNIHDIIYNSVESFCLEACPKDVELQYRLQAKNAEIKADPLHLRNVINNLVDNAIKYSGVKPIIQLCTLNKENGLLLDIIDNGIGISKEAQKRVFDKFYRVSTGDIHNVKGFGLGLYYVKSIVSAHQGEVYLSSNLNKGTKVSIYLPYSP